MCIVNGAGDIIVQNNRLLKRNSRLRGQTRLHYMQVAGELEMLSLNIMVRYALRSWNFTTLKNIEKYRNYII